MRIGLNLLPVRDGIGGTWNYIATLMASLAAEDDGNEYVAFVTPASAMLVPRHEKFTSVLSHVPTAFRPLRVLHEHTMLPIAVRRAKLDCLHHVFGTLPVAGAVPTVVTIYDLIEFARPTDFGQIKRRYLRIMRRRAAERATVLAPMSQSTADELHRRLHVPWHRMQVVLPVVAPSFRPQTPEPTEEFRDGYRLPAEFWLAIGDGHPRENLHGLLHALALLRRGNPEAWPLVIRGTPDKELRSLIGELGLEDAVSFLPRLTDAAMPALYASASALVFPSLLEGCGLPVLEALACACPLVASAIPTTQEFAKGAAFTFDPLSAESIAGAMRRCMEDPEARRDHVNAGLELVARRRELSMAAACGVAYRRARELARPR